MFVYTHILNFLCYPFSDFWRFFFDKLCFLKTQLVLKINGSRFEIKNNETIPIVFYITMMFANLAMEWRKKVKWSTHLRSNLMRLYSPADLTDESFHPHVVLALFYFISFLYLYYFVLFFVFCIPFNHFCNHVCIWHYANKERIDK